MPRRGCPTGHCPSPQGPGGRARDSTGGTGAAGGTGQQVGRCGESRAGTAGGAAQRGRGGRRRGRDGSAQPGSAHQVALWVEEGAKVGGHHLHPDHALYKGQQQQGMAWACRCRVFRVLPSERAHPAQPCPALSAAPRRARPAPAGPAVQRAGGRAARAGQRSRRTRRPPRPSRSTCPAQCACTCGAAGTWGWGWAVGWVARRRRRKQSGRRGPAAAQRRAEQRRAATTAQRLHLPPSVRVPVPTCSASRSPRPAGLPTTERSARSARPRASRRAGTA